MKKILNLLIVFILIITLTACTNGLKEKPPIEVLDEVATNMSKVNPFEIILGLDAIIIQDGKEIDMPLSLSIAQNFVDFENYKAVLKLNDNPFLGEQTFYILLEDASSKIYMPGKLIAFMVGITDNSNNWIVEPIGLDEKNFNVAEAIKQYDGIDIKTLLKEDEFVLIEEDKNVNKYQLKITKDLLIRIQEALEVEEKETFEKLTEAILIDVYIDMKTKKITKIELDLKDIVSKMISDEALNSKNVSMDTFKKLKISLEMKYNNIKVEIPTNIIKNAMTAEEYGNYLMSKLQG